jgi:WD40 repeat protein
LVAQSIKEKAAKGISLLSFFKAGIMITVWLLPVVFFYSITIIAMEYEITSQSPRLWVNSLTDQKKGSKYGKLLKNITAIISNQEPLQQLKLYSSMIDAALELEDAKKLITSLFKSCETVYNKHLYQTSDEEKALEYVASLREILKSKKDYKGIFNLLHFSTSGALPPLPLQEDSQQARKTSISGSNNTIPLRNQNAGSSEDPFAKECVVYRTEHTARAIDFFEDKLVAATADGAIVAYDYKTGSLLFTSRKRVENKNPLIIISFDVASINKKLKIKHLESGCHSIVYTPEKNRMRCIMPTGDFLVVGNADGEVIGEKFSEKKMIRYEGHTQAVTALYALGRLRFLSGSDDGFVKLWESRKRKCQINIEVGSVVNDITEFDGNILCVCGSNQLRMLIPDKKKSIILYKSDESIKKIIGFNDILVAGLKNGSLRLWHKDEGYNKTALLNLTPSAHIYKLVLHDQDLLCCYKNGMVIKYPYSFLSKAFRQASVHGFDSVHNKAPSIYITEQ